MNKNNRGDIPYIYAFATIALFVDTKDMQEVLTLVKAKGFIKKWILQFSLKGSYKVITPGILQEDKSLELHRIQLHQEEKTRSNVLDCKVRIKRTYANFIGKDELLKPLPLPKNVGFYYQKLLRYYGFAHSFPLITKYEDAIKQIKAERLSKVRLTKVANVQKIIDERLYSGKAPELPKFDTNVNTIKSSFTNIFRRDDVFMREVMAFLGDVDNTWFGQNWQIRENTVLWQDPSTKVEFDIRRKTKPSKNALSSIYPLVYHKDSGGDIASLSRFNLRAMVASILLNNNTKGMDFKALHATATAEISAPKNETPNNQQHWKKLVEECSSWNRHQQACLVIKYIRKHITKHFHLQDSIEFHQMLLHSIYAWDGSSRSLQSDLQEVFSSYDITIPNEVVGIFRAKNLEALAKIVCEDFADIKAPKNKSGEKTHVLFRTWKPHAFSPTKSIAPTIQDALKWQDLQKGDLFDILVKHFEENDFAYPDIVQVYINDKKNTSLQDLLKNPSYQNDKKALKEERAIRETLTEELLLFLVAFYYVDKIKGESSYMELKPNNTSDKKSPVAYNIIWNLEPKLEISLEDYNKKNIKQILNWLFDPRRINTPTHKFHKHTDKDLAQKCMGSFEDAVKTVTNSSALKSKAPKNSSRFEGSQQTLDLENKYKKILWVQREMIAQICEIEKDLIYRLERLDLNEEDKNWLNKTHYYEFPILLALYNKYYLKIPTNPDAKNDRDKYGALNYNIGEARKMLAHGKLLGKEDMTYAKTIQAIEDFNEALGRKSLWEYYNPKRR